MLSEMDFLDTWIRMASAIREWLASDDEAPIKGNLELLKCQRLRVFENLFKVWSDNVPVKEDPDAMKKIRDHRKQLVISTSSDPNVILTLSKLICST